MASKNLDLFPPPGAKFEERDLQWLIDWLKDRDWTLGADILRAHNLPVSDSTLRTVRAWASGSGGRICSGQRGYKLTKSMTKEEFETFNHTMQSQAREMLRRAVESTRVFQGSIPPTFPIVSPIPATPLQN
jgi:hypothetical protein